MSAKALPLIFGAGLLALIAALFRPKHASASELPALPPPEPIKLPETTVLVPPPDEAAHVDEDTKKDIQAEVDDSKSKLPSTFSSVISGVDNAKWTQYVNAQKTAKLNSVTSANNLGLFSMGYPMLQQLGYVQNAHKVLINGRTVWDGDFIPPLTKAEFMSNALLQYEAFAKMTVQQANTIRTKYADILKGSNITLSGLLAVAKYAGMGGLDAWLKEPARRKPDTTAEFTKFNGMF